MIFACLKCRSAANETFATFVIEYDLVVVALRLRQHCAILVCQGPGELFGAVDGNLIVWIVPRTHLICRQNRLLHLIGRYTVHWCSGPGVEIRLLGDGIGAHPIKD